MKTKVKQYVLALAALFMFAVPLAVPALAGAQSQPGQVQINTGLCAGSTLSATSTDQCDTASTTQTATDNVNNIIKTVINIFSLVVGVVSVIMIIIGGFRYITSGGESGSVSGAKNTIMYAIIGLVIVALAQVIVQFVLGKVAPTN